MVDLDLDELDGLIDRAMTEMLATVEPMLPTPAELTAIQLTAMTGLSFREALAQTRRPAPAAPPPSEAGPSVPQSEGLRLI